MFVKFHPPLLNFICGVNYCLCADVLDGSAPGASLHSVDSQTSLEESPGPGVFDEEGLLFGDSELLIWYTSVDFNHSVMDAESCDDPLGSALGERNSRLTGGRLWLTQFYALLVKRLLYTRGNLVALIVQNVFPLLVICLSLYIAKILQTVDDPPPLELSPHLFFAKSRYNYLFAGGYSTNTTAPLINSLFQPCGVSVSAKDSVCYYNSSRSVLCSNYPSQQYSCSCQTCDEQSSLPLSFEPPSCYDGTGTGSRVLNLTLPYNASDPDVGYLSLHNYLLRSTDAFIQHRYGGVSFGHNKQIVADKVDELNSIPTSTLPFLATHSAAKVWYSFKGYHAMPAYLNTMNNAILRGSLSKGSQTKQQSDYGEKTSTVEVLLLTCFIS